MYVEMYKNEMRLLFPTLGLHRVLATMRNCGCKHANLTFSWKKQNKQDIRSNRKESHQSPEVRVTWVRVGNS